MGLETLGHDWASLDLESRPISSELHRKDTLSVLSLSHLHTCMVVGRGPQTCTSC